MGGVDMRNVVGQGSRNLAKCQIWVQWVITILCTRLLFGDHCKLVFCS